MAYQDYTTDDFLRDPAFQRWVLHSTSDDNVFWADVLATHPNQRVTIQNARTLLLTVHEQVEADFPSEQQVDTLFGRIQDGMHETTVVRPLWQRNWWRVAASVLLILGLGGWWFSQSGSPFSSTVNPTALFPKPGLEEVINNSLSPLAVNLPDGSRATLKPQSRLSYPNSFAGTKREVYLTGEAFFEVKKDPKKPFLVYANALTTKVLGTSFWVRAYEQDKQVTVIVKTGRVSVFPTKNTQHRDPETLGLVLTPNQQVVLDKDDEQFTRTLVEKPALLLSGSELQPFAFTNAPLPQILRAVTKAYGVDIIFDEELLADCRLTTSLTNETLFEKLDIICEGIGGTYKVVDSQVIIDVKGCN